MYRDTIAMTYCCQMILSCEFKQAPAKLEQTSRTETVSSSYEVASNILHPTLCAQYKIPSPSTIRMKRIRKIKVQRFTRNSPPPSVRPRKETVCLPNPKRRSKREKPACIAFWPAPNKSLASPYPFPMHFARILDTNKSSQAATVLEKKEKGRNTMERAKLIDLELIGGLKRQSCASPQSCL
jgi:hypothetical protein